MDQRELYCMIFFVLDAAWNETHDPELGLYLSGANPFLFTDGDSADPAVYQQFCRIVSHPVPLENSFEVAKAYVASLHQNALDQAFSGIDQREWIACVREYRSQRR